MTALIQKLGKNIEKSRTITNFKLISKNSQTNCTDLLGSLLARDESAPVYSRSLGPLMALPHCLVEVIKNSIL
jgi:mannitol/fructose-specific phosphotransferase system IIA component (Ntr-type)